jgi:glycosyltransferase involved in cell wall biosynthesis
MSKLRIGLFCYARKKNGGTLSYSRTMVNAISSANESDECEIIVYASDVELFSDIHNVTVKKVPNLFYLFVNFLFPRLRFINVDIAVAPVYSISLLMLRVPFFFTLHDLQEMYYPQYFAWYRRVWRRMANATLLFSCKGVICESKYVKGDIIKFYNTKAEKIHVLPGPASVEFSKKDIEMNVIDNVKNKYNLPTRYIFYPAQFWLHKNHALLLLAFRELKSSGYEGSLVLTGAKAHDYVNIESKIIKYGLANAVINLGYVDQFYMPYVYHLSECVVVPTLFESISIPAFEAFSMGVPLCISNVCGLPEQVNGAAVLFDPKDVNQIVAAIKTSVNDHNVRTSCVNKGFEIINSYGVKQYGIDLYQILNPI